MFDDVLRAFKDRALAPLAALLAGRLTPNAISVLACLAGVACAAAAWRGRPVLSVLLWLLNRTLDGLDGAVARQAGAESDLGAYLDILLDFVVYALVPIGIGLARPGGVPLALVVLLATFYVNAASWMFLSALLERSGRGAAAAGQRTRVAMPAGLIGGFETIVLYTLALAWPAWAVPLFWTMAALVVVTVLQRFFWARRHLPSAPQPPPAA